MIVVPYYLIEILIALLYFILKWELQAGMYIKNRTENLRVIDGTPPEFEHDRDVWLISI